MDMKTVQTQQGALRGVHKQTYTVFRGVPYAKPPVGRLRWMPPQPADAWSGVRDAKCFGPRCVQNEQPPGSFYHKEFFNDEDFLPRMSEDCLYLNIWTPDERGGGPLPVALWIHGGAFIGGYGTEPEFDGEAFCKRGVILVTFNYRLGALGFLAHPWLSAESPEGASGNYGILDQIAALRWVYQNISAFGGDPSQIAVFGQSAGSISVQTLVSTDLTRGMISKSILQSAGGYNAGVSRDRTLREAEEIGESFVKLLGVESLEALRALPPERLMEATGEVFADCMKERKGLPFSPVVDGYVLKQGYGEAVDAGMHHDIPYMIGSTRNDIGSTPEMVARDEKSALYEGCVNWSLKNEALGRAPSYVYYFTRQLLGDDAGAFHSSELWYVFGTLHRSWRPKEAADWDLQASIGEYWCNFIKNGDPNGPAVAEWPACTKEDPFVKNLG